MYIGIAQFWEYCSWSSGCRFLVQISGCTYGDGETPISLVRT